MNEPIHYENRKYPVGYAATLGRILDAVIKAMTPQLERDSLACILAATRPIEGAQK